GNWELSSARANASRRELVASGLDSDKLLVVSGMADRVPLPGTKPSDAVNRRIELLILTPLADGQIRHDSSLRRPVALARAGADPAAAGRDTGEAGGRHRVLRHVFRRGRGTAQRHGGPAAGPRSRAAGSGADECHLPRRAF